MGYTVFVGTPEETLAAYRAGECNSPLPPKWCFGYVHCRERFKSAEELLAVARRFREEKLPVDVMVQDRRYWGRHGWNAMHFDEDDYPDPKAMVDALHAMDMRLMLSVWSRIDKESEVGGEMERNAFYIPGTQWVDFFNPDAAKCYWRNFSERLLKPYGIDAWWLDATEPENDDLAGRSAGGDEVMSVARRQLALRYRLLPYIYSLAHAATKGAATMRTMMMAFPEDREAWRCEQEFMFGPSILVAPVLECGVDEMNVYLPQVDGGWY